MKWACAALTLLLVSSLSRADDSPSTLASSIAQARDAWLIQDDASAEARVSALATDPRIAGEMTRWFAGFDAALKFKRNNVAGATKSLAAVVSKARDARTYFRAARLLLAFDQAGVALAFAREGRKLHPDSRALSRLEAELLWLTGDREAALEACHQIVASVPSAGYPYERPRVGYWEQVEPWEESGEKTPSEEAAGEGMRRGRPIQIGKEEPACSLCLPPVWFITDLPGLERCIAECARDDKRARQAAEALATLLDEVTRAQDAVDTAREGVEQRARLEQALRYARAKAVTEARIAVLYEVSQGNGAKAEEIARRGLRASKNDVGLMDALAQALALQGKAEESRQFPLGELNRNASLCIVPAPYVPGTATWFYDRIFDAARMLAKANPQAGKVQLEALRTAFGAGNDSTMIDPGNLGLWLLHKGDDELAGHYLNEAARLHSADAHPGGSASWLLPWLSLQLEGLKKKPKPPADAADAAPNAWLDFGQRAGLVRGQSLDLSSYLAGMGNPSLYMNYRWNSYELLLPNAARSSKSGEAFLPVLLHELPSLIGANCTAQELDAYLAETSVESKQLRTTLDQFATLVDEVAANRQNWDAREKGGQRAVPVLAALEARALLIQARFAQQPPGSLEELSRWLAKYQAVLDPRRIFKSLPLDDEDLYYGDLRVKNKVPEIFHSGLLLDAALALARKGAFGEAGKLLLLNPRPWLDGVSQGRRMHLAALFLRKAGLPELEFKARMTMAWRENVGPPALALFEFPRARSEILEFGQAQDVLDYTAAWLVLGMRGSMIDQLVALSPELQKADPVLWLRNTPQDGASFLFANSVQNSSIAVIVDNWPKILMTGDPMGTIWRMAIWCLVSDLPLAYRSDDSGMAPTSDTLACWRMLAQDLALAGGAMKPAAEKLQKLYERCGGVTVAPDADEDE